MRFFLITGSLIAGFYGNFMSFFTIVFCLGGAGRRGGGATKRRDPVKYRYFESSSTEPTLVLTEPAPKTNPNPKRCQF